MYRGLFVCVVLLAAVGRPAGSSQTPDDTAHLFGPSASQSARSFGAVPLADTNSRVVEVATDHLGDARLVLDLVGGHSLVARRQHVERTDDGSQIWSGTVEGEPLSAVTFVQVDDVVQGSIRSSRGTFSLEPLASGPDHLLRQVDPQQTAEERLPLVPPPAPRLDTARSLAMDDGSTIDLFVVYTAAARQQAGGSDAAVKARIALGVAETNLALANSQLTSRLRLVGSELVGYRESDDLSTDLVRLTTDGDGVLDQVHARRRAVAADLVQLVVGSVAGGACGIAWVMQTVSVSFAPYAFSVTAYPCISPNYTFGHELAHNLGTAHAPQDPNVPPAFPYAYGYKDPEQRFRTIMAYDCPAGCPRVLHFSSPSVTYEGQITGTPDQHDNALALSQTAFTAANFNASRLPETLLGPPTSFEVVTASTTVSMSWTPPDAGTPTVYSIEVGSDEGFADVATFVVDASMTRFAQALVPPGSYWIRVRGVDASGPGAPSASVSLRMTERGRCLAPVTRPALAEADVQDLTVRLTWSAPVEGYPIDRFLIGVGRRPQGFEAGVIDTASPALTFASEAEPGVYFVRVAGVNACGIGEISNETAVVVGPPLPGPPSALRAVVSTGRAVSFSWQPPAAGGAVTEYAIEAGDAPGRANLAVLRTDSPEPSFAIVAPPGRYFVRVRAVNAHGRSVPSHDLDLRVP